MALYDKPLDQIRPEDILSLKVNQEREGLHIEYKQALPDDRPDSKRKLLEAVSSFANASGGDILFGVREARDTEGNPTGVPEEFCGVGEVNRDTLQQRMLNSLRDALDPSVSGIRFGWITVEGDKVVLIARVLRSWIGPHMVKESYRFYSRNSSGKYPLGVQEIRQAFVRSEITSDRLRRLRAERLANVVAGETPVALTDGPKVILHLVPLSALDLEGRADLDRAYDEAGLLMPIGGAGELPRYNFDGLLMVGGRSSSDAYAGYTQLFRTGAIESVSSQPFNVGPRSIASTAFEEGIVQVLRSYLSLEQRLAVASPFVLMLSLVGVKDYSLAVGSRFHSSERKAVDRDLLAVPEQLIEDLPTDPQVQDIAQWLRSSFDALWNACGYAGSLNCDDQGHWNPRQRRGA